MDLASDLCALPSTNMDGKKNFSRYMACKMPEHINDKAHTADIANRHARNSSGESLSDGRV